MKVIIGLVVGGILGYGAACMVHYGVPGMAANASMTAPKHSFAPLTVIPAVTLKVLKVCLT